MHILETPQATLTSRADSVQSRLASCAVAARRRELAGKVR